jgi:hypothetical protein
MADGDVMNGLGRQLEDSGGAGESVERVLDAIGFQTAILTLNAAVEAAHAAEPGMGARRSPARFETWRKTSPDDLLRATES